MSPRTFVTRAAALFALAALGAACETKTIVQPPPTDIVVTVSPLQATLTKVGQQVQFVAQVTGAGTNGNTGVTWKSSNTAVATVAATGNTATVTAVANGVTSIIATSAQDANKQSSAVVTVAIDSGQKVVPPTVSINAITTSAGTPATLTDIFGPINIVLNVDVPPGNTVSAVNWLLDGKTFCSQTFTAGKSADATTQAADAVTMSCQLNTAAVDSITGAPLYANGPHTLSAALVGPTGTVLASTSQQLVFNNESTVGFAKAGASGSKTALDAAGLQWNGGTLTVKIVPSIFSNEVLKTVAVQVHDPVNGLTSTKVITVSSNAPFTVTFPADSAAGSTNGDATEGVMNFESANTTVTITSAITSAGQNFSGALNDTTIRLDNKAPAVTVQPTFLINTVTGGTTMWLSLANTFSTSCSGTGAANTFDCQLSSTVTDAGVDVVKATFQISPNTSTKTWSSVTAFSALTQAAANTMVSRVQFCDALGNCSNSSTSAAFGIDLVPPTITAVTNISGVQTPPKTISVAAVDTLSGFDLVNGYIQVQITKDSAKSDGSDVKTCFMPGDANTTALPSSGSCAFNTIVGTSLTVPPATNPDGYYTVVIQAADVAGNVSTQTTRFFLFDGVAPVVSGVTVTYTTGAATAAVSATVHDNVDLLQFNSRESFAAAFVDAVTSIPFTAPTVVKAFGIPVQGNATGSVTMPVILGIQAAFGGAPININGLGFSALDQASNYGESFATFATSASAGVSTTDIVVANSLVAADNATICADPTDPTCTTTKTTATPTAVLVMNNTVTANPFVTVYFYRVDASGRAVYISQTAAGSLTIPASGANANLRVYTYTGATLAATALPSSTGAPAGTNDVFAIGVDKNGNGVVIGKVTITVQP